MKGQPYHEFVRNAAAHRDRGDRETLTERTLDAQLERTRLLYGCSDPEDCIQRGMHGFPLALNVAELEDLERATDYALSASERIRALSGKLARDAEALLRRAFPGNPR